MWNEPPKGHFTLTFVDAPGLQSHLDELVAELRNLTSGEVASYIPELARALPDDFGIAVAMADGKLYTAGEACRLATIQSVSKPFMYAAALARHGRDHVLKRVGVEPTGERFNAIILDEVQNRPFNPMVNAGAIATAAMMTASNPADGEAWMLDLFSRLAGRPLQIDQNVFRSEDETGHRNRAIAWLMLNSGMIEVSPDLALDLYFKQCSVNISCADLAVMAATLATQGIQPVTGERVYPVEAVRDTLSVMTTCGMYDYAGQWLFDVGLPAKSGVSGMIMAVVPGQLGLAVYSPPVDAVGNSVRGIEVCRRFAQDYGLHACLNTLDPTSVIRRTYTAKEVHSNRQRSAAERAAINAEGDLCTVFELQGPLYLAAAEQVARNVADAADRCSMIVIDFRRTGTIDPAAVALLAQMPDSVNAETCQLCFIEMESSTFTPPLRERIAARADGEAILGYADADAALETFEEAVLARTGQAFTGDAFRFSALDIFSGLGPADIAALEKAASTFSYAPGDTIIRTGDEALAFYVVARGRVSITVATGSGRSRRVSSVGAGQVFGEMAMLDTGRRSANAVADDHVICHAFAIGYLRELSEERPQIMMTILANLSRSLAERLRAANEQVRTFE